MNNKEKILQGALQLFNDNGCVNVRLQHISDLTVISVGNIAYHFKNKEAIVSGIYDEMDIHLKDLLTEYRSTPIFIRIDRIWDTIWKIQQKYSFIYADIIEIQRAYPAVFERIAASFEIMALWIEDILRFNIARGALRQPDDDLQVSFLAKQLIRTIIFYRSYLYLGWDHTISESSESFKDELWRTLLPYMTEEGTLEYHVTRENKVVL